MRFCLADAWAGRRTGTSEIGTRSIATLWEDREALWETLFASFGDKPPQENFLPAANHCTDRGDISPATLSPLSGPRRPIQPDPRPGTRICILLEKKMVLPHLYFLPAIQLLLRGVPQNCTKVKIFVFKNYIYIALSINNSRTFI